MRAAAAGPRGSGRRVRERGIPHRTTGHRALARRGALDRRCRTHRRPRCDVRSLRRRRRMDGRRRGRRCRGRRGVNGVGRRRRWRRMCPLLLSEARRRDQHAQDDDPDAKPSLHMNTPAGGEPRSRRLQCRRHPIHCNDFAIGPWGNLPHSAPIVGRLVPFFEDGPGSFRTVPGQPAIDDWQSGD